MSKTIDKVNNEIIKALEKAEQSYREACDSYNDTGYDKYFTKMQKAEKEIEELNDFLKRGQTVVKELSTDQYKEYLKMKQDLKSLKNKLFYLVSDLGLPATTELIGMQDILRDY